MKLWRNLIILLVGVGVLVGAYFLITNTNAPDEEASPSPTESEKVYIVDVKFEDVAKAETSSSVEKVTYTPGTEEKTWTVTNPVVEEGVLDPEQVNSNANSFLQIEAHSVIEQNPKDLAKYGLDNPTNTLTITLKDGSTRTLSLGDLSTTVGRYFAYSKENDTVYTVFDLNATPIRKKLSELKKSMTYKFPSEGITELIVERSGKETIHITTEEGRTTDKFDAKFTELMMVSPYNDFDINSVNLSSMVYTPLSGVSFKSISALDSTDYASYGLDAPWTRIWMKYTVEADESTGTKAHTEEKELLISPLKGGKYYAKLGDYDAIFEFSKSTFEFVDNIDPYHLINRIGFITNIDTVESINLWLNDKEHLVTINQIPAAEEGADPTQEVIINGTKAQTDTGKLFYREIIGLAFEGLYKGTGEPTGKPLVKVQINLSNGTSKLLELIPINERECSYTLNGKTQFIAKTATIESTIEKLEKIIADPTAEVGE